MHDTSSVSNYLSNQCLQRKKGKKNVHKIGREKETKMSAILAGRGRDQDGRVESNLGNRWWEMCTGKGKKRKKIIVNITHL